MGVRFWREKDREGEEEENSDEKRFFFFFTVQCFVWVFV